MSNPRKCSIPTSDANIVLEQLLAEDSFGESDLCIHFCYIRIRDKFCLEITRTVFILYFHTENESDLIQPQRACLCKINTDSKLHFFFFLREKWVKKEKSFLTVYPGWYQRTPGSQEREPFFL
uniref:Uncharacterized protein n=1 Tax=Rousettus aegyptiacus TaxID=9407 RepID=A0A7J8H2N0_ROUAE|nr:hypothetical protein HJG63_011345 [Rousettus aegyptiacus]